MDNGSASNENGDQERTDGNGVELDNGNDEAGVLVLDDNGDVGIRQEANESTDMLPDNHENDGNARDESDGLDLDVGNGGELDNGNDEAGVLVLDDNGDVGIGQEANESTDMLPDNNENDGNARDKSDGLDLDVLVDDNGENAETDELINNNGSDDNEHVQIGSVEVVNAEIKPNIDPGKLSEYLTQQEKDEIVNIGFEVLQGEKNLLTFVFPRSAGTRKFSTTHLYRHHDEKKILRKWLIYSKSLDAIFCIACKLFNTNANAFSAQGYSDWFHVSRDCKGHETALPHLNAMQKFNECRRRQQSNLCIDESLQEQYELEIKFMRSVFERLVEIIKVCGERNLALRGTGGHEQLDDPNNGNFLRMVEMFAKFDPIMSELIRKFKNKEITDNYLSKGIQNEIIELISNKIKENILDNIKAAKYFVIILDCTPDISHQEQLSVTIRCVDISGNSVNIKEYFLGFYIMHKQDAETYKNTILNLLQKWGLDIMNCVGQCYDNASSMSGKYNGLQQKIKDINPWSWFSNCASHSLNLIICDCANCNVKFCTFFGVLNTIYSTFFNSTV